MAFCCLPHCLSLIEGHAALLQIGACFDSCPQPLDLWLAQVPGRCSAQNTTIRSAGPARLDKCHHDVAALLSSSCTASSFRCILRLLLPCRSGDLPWDSGSPHSARLDQQGGPLATCSGRTLCYVKVEFMTGL